MNNEFDREMNASLAGFSDEAAHYCQGISDVTAQKYAIDYTKMLETRIKGFETSLPRIPAGLFEPNRNLIRLTLERMCEKYFPAK